MKQFTLDCSVSAAWCFSDQKNHYVNAILDSFVEGYEALVPAIWQLETLNILILAERKKLISEAETSHFLELFCSLPIHAETAQQSLCEYRGIVPLARRYGLTSCDSAYLDTALRNGIPLATQDRSLQKACRKSGITIFLAEQLPSG